MSSNEVFKENEMKKSEIINLLNDYMTLHKVDFYVDEKSMDMLVLDISRICDKKYTEAINRIKKETGIKINSIEKEEIRKYFIGYPSNKGNEEFKKYVPEISSLEIEDAYKSIAKGFQLRESVMINSLIARIRKNFIIDNNRLEYNYLEYIKEIQQEKKQLLIIEADENNSPNEIINTISEKYDNISNFHYTIIIFNEKNSTYSWKKISEVAILMENLKNEKDFKVYKKNKRERIEELQLFIENNENIKNKYKIKEEIEDFYEDIPYGFQFEDLFITRSGKIKVLVMQKVELDESPKKCPSCMEKNARGNSYPKILYKSFECQNPSCPSRSKIGRGKRYDLFSAKRQVMLDRNSPLDRINDKIYSAFRRDIIEDIDFSIENIIKLYSWEDDSVEIITSEEKKLNNFGRKLYFDKLYSLDKHEKETSIRRTRIFKLLDKVASSIEFSENIDKVYFEKDGESYLCQGDSTKLVPNIEKILEIKEIGGAVTSPPYYNAREYSQWCNLICYFIDMMINAKAILTSLDKDGTYIYNIGDIVDQDNIYIKSNMSKRRQMLGFYSIFIFELVGYKTIGNIIWDKGEVQSKRNSTPNHISGYIKPVNAYEHCIIFNKNRKKELIPTNVIRIEPVKKINSKGENILGHTAPYPKAIAELITKFVNKNKYVIDPFLGSGTTIIALKEKGYMAIGFELNKDYFSLALKRIKNESPIQV
ncbi:site-specific DNA-methyltransferase [Pasteurella multocida]|uniref:site-specific DNA-methyltransferase n=1 Tax=Pasteurella multocida TaxID=747 RepID=UPI0020240977|nr:site-specific DNA-methyltransferase [Pasteurella multocida]URJ85726.1 site-specific DNA-methyltransferase [Pasteurella multocida]